MSLKFKPEDFSGVERTYEIAQRIFDEWLSKQPVIYGVEDLGDIDWVGPRNNIGETHQARLVCIEEIKKCELHKWKSIATELAEALDFYQHGWVGNGGDRAKETLTKYKAALSGEGE